MRKLIMTGGTFLVLAACGGGGAGTSDMTPEMPTPPANYTPAFTFEALVTAEQSLRDTRASNITTTANLPDTTVTYDGAINFYNSLASNSPTSDRDIAGTLELVVDFNTNTVSGTVDDLIARNGAAFPDALTLSNGRLTTASGGGTLRGDFNGSLTDQNGDVAEFETFLTQSRLYGDAGADASGLVSGKIEYRGNTDQFAFGTFSAD